MRHSRTKKLNFENWARNHFYFSYLLLAGVTAFQASAMVCIVCAAVIFVYPTLGASIHNIA